MHCRGGWRTAGRKCLEKAGIGPWTQRGGERAGWNPASFGGTESQQSSVCLTCARSLQEAVCLAPHAPHEARLGTRTLALRDASSAPAPQTRARADAHRHAPGSRAGAAPCTLHAAARRWAGALSDVPLRRPHPPGSLAVLPEISSRFKFDWVKVDHRKTEAQEGQVQEGRKIEFFWCEEEKGSDVLN